MAERAIKGARKGRVMPVLSVSSAALDMDGAAGRLPTLPVTVRPVRANDLAHLMVRVGPLVEGLYPQGAAKLLARLEDSINGYATAHVAVSRLSANPLALASEVAKGKRATKVSTFWVDPETRRRGVGAQLLDSRIEAWLRSGQERVVVTVRESRAVELQSLFVPRGFERLALDLHRYGQDRSEVVLQWRPPIGASSAVSFDAVAAHSA